MKAFGALLAGIALFAANQPATVCAETESIDLKALAKKARPAVMLLVVSDATGKEIATGTGFLVSSDGKLITNFHVIEKAASAVAKAENGGLFPVEGVLASDPKNDLVLLKIKAKELPYLTLGKSENIEVGTRIAVIGSPLGLEGTLSEGIVSAVRELMGDIRKLQITAAISPGSSGSPVMNAKGEVIGIASALLRGGQALNLAAPVECAVRLMSRNTATAQLQPLGSGTGAVIGEDAIYSDADSRAACAAEASDDFVEMLKHVKVLVTRYPENAAAWFALGCAFADLNFTDDAIASFRQAIKIKPDYAEGWFGLGVAYGKSGRLEDEIAAYRQVIKLRPDFFEAWYNLGHSYNQSGRIEKAIEAYQQAVKVKKDYAPAWRNLGNAYFRASRIEDSVAAYEQALRIQPDSAKAWSGLGLAHIRMGRTNDGVSALRKAVKLNPDQLDAWLSLALAYKITGQVKEADDALSRSKALMSQKPK